VFLSKSYYSNDKIVDVYKAFMYKFILQMNTTKNSMDLRNDVDKIFEIEKELALVLLLLNFFPWFFFIKS
jgi:hypothetical protein